MRRDVPLAPSQRLVKAEVQVITPGGLPLAGQTLCVRASFTVSGEPVDVENPMLVIASPSSAVDRVDLVREECGAYCYALLAEAGQYILRVETTGERATAVERTLRVRPSRVEGAS